MTTDNTPKAARSTIRWTNEERELLKLDLIEIFTKGNLHYDNWTVTVRLLMQAQLDILPPERFRDYLPQNDVLELQGRIDAHLESISTEDILRKHKEYIQQWKMAPIAHAAQLLADNAELHSNLERAIKERDEAISKYKATIAEHAVALDNAIRRVTAAPVPAAKERAVAAKIDTWSEQEEAPSKINWDNLLEDDEDDTPQPPKAKLIIAALHPNSMQRAMIDVLADVYWVEPNQGTEAVASAAIGRHALVNPSACGTPIVKIIRKNAKSYEAVRGFSSLRNSVERLAEQSLTSQAGIAAR